MTRINIHCRKLLLMLIALGLFLLPAAALAEEIAAEEDAIVYEARSLTEQEQAYLTDGDCASRIRITAGTALVWELSEEAEALRLLWHNMPKGVHVYAVDAAGELLGDVYGASGVYETAIPLPAGSAAIRIEADADAILSEIAPITAAQAENMSFLEPDQVDVLIIAAHTGDEAAIYSGLIPTISAAGRTSLTVFTSCKSREARQDAYDTARAYLQPYEPQFLDHKYLLIAESQKERTYKIWPENTLVAEITALIRKYRPAVVVSHAPKGEEDEGMHRLMARVVEKAVSDAANVRRERKSLQEYGTHAVQKLYLHGEPEPEKPRKYARTTPTPVPEASVVLEYDKLPLDAFFGRTALEVAQTATDAYKSIRVLHKTAESKGSYWLAYSAVGADSGANDLFEHLDAGQLSQDIIILPTPTPVPQAAPKPLPTPIPTVSAQTGVSAADTDGAEAQASAPLLPAAVLLLAAIAASVLLFRFVHKKLKEKLPAVPSAMICLLPVLIAAAAAILLIRPAPAVRTSAATATPALTATPVPTEEPTPSPSLSPEEEKALAWAEYFRAEDEVEEVVVFDDENGHWEYRSDTLSVLIDRHEKPEVPLVYYVAHIRMLEDAFRPGFGSIDEAGSAKLEPWRLARRAGAVLALTGDNLINDEVWRKGRLIRNGIVYGEGNAQPTLALCPDMTLRIYEVGTPVEEILFAGVENTYGFGPVLVRDGAVAKDECMGHRVKNKNPRAGIGMVEQGHYVAIVVDGRQAGYSIGVTLTDYAEMFIEEGCTMAYNMDGGISSGMLFMGEGIHQHRSSKSKKSSGQRPWADALLFGYSELVPDEDDPIYNTGNLDEKKQRETETP